jgi:hypothetical protein
VDCAEVKNILLKNIERASLQVKIRESDWDQTRFAKIWRKQRNRKKINKGQRAVAGKCKSKTSEQEYRQKRPGEFRWLLAVKEVRKNLILLIPGNGELLCAFSKHALLN